MLFEHFITVFVGVLIILFSAEYSVKYAIRLANNFGLSDTFIGMTVLSIGTSLPEIITHIFGSIKILKEPSLMDKVSGLVIGTNIGSDIFQQNFLLGLVALIGAVVVTKKHLKENIGGLIGAALIVLFFAFNGFISRWEGALLVIGYGLYLMYIHKRGTLEADEIDTNNHNNIFIDILILLVCFIIMGFSADKVVDSSTILVQQLPISASFFGVILLGIAAALPELTTSLIAVFKGKHKISGGILIGSNVTNPMLALGIGALISGYTVPKVVIFFDLPVKIITACLIFYFFSRNVKLKKSYAILLIFAYLLYLFIRNLYFPVDVF